MKRKSLADRHRGFTMIEVIMVIAIIAVLLAVIIPIFSTARAQARDKQRMADIGRLTLAMRLYVQQYGIKIDCVSGMKIDGSQTDGTGTSGTCNDGTKIANFLKAYFNGNVPHDPLGPGNKDYYYYFDGSRMCSSATNGGWQPVLFAANLEKEPSNMSSVCDAPGGPSNNDGGFWKTTSLGGTKDPSQPYVEILNFVTKA